MDSGKRKFFIIEVVLVLREFKAQRPIIIVCSKGIVDKSPDVAWLT
jgi:hypothetical protein